MDDLTIPAESIAAEKESELQRKCDENEADSE